MENAIWAALGVIFGIPAGFLTNYLWDYFKLRERRLSLMNLCGLWVERFADSEEGGFALGSFRWDSFRKEYRYDGTRFDVDGNPKYEWGSRSLFSDDKLGAIVYTYELFNSNAQPIYGLGEIKYGVQAGSPSIQFVKGVFSDGDEGIDVRHNMQRFSEFARGESLQEGEESAARIKLGKHVARILAEPKK